MVPGQPGPELSAVLARHACTAEVETVLHSGRGSEEKVRSTYAVLDGKIRMEMNFSDIEGIPPEVVDQMRRMGTDRVVTISLPEKRVLLFVYPGLESYCEMSLAGEEKDAAFRTEREEVGKETLDEHPCVKTIVTVTAPDGTKTEMTVWEATDLDSFPVQVRTTQGGAIVTTRFTKIKRAKPDAQLFDPPAGYKKYASMEQMMMGQMMKRVGGSGGPRR